MDRRQRNTYRELAPLLRSLSMATREGASVSASLEATVPDIEDRDLRAIIEDTLTGLRAGKPLSDGLSLLPSLGQTLAALVRAGEKTGDLPRALEQVATQVESQLKLDAAVRRATRYPKLVNGALLAGAGAGLLLWHRRAA